MWKSLADLQADTRQVTSETGMAPMADEVAIGALSLVLGPDAPVQSSVVDADWPVLAAAYRTRGALRILDDVLADADDAIRALPESEFRKALRNSAPNGAATCWPTTWGRWRRR